MNPAIFPDRAAMALAAATSARKILRETIVRSGSARLVVATGASQLEFLQHLTAADDVDWSRVDGFHLDEYIGLSADHPASFRRYLRERFVEHLPNLRSFTYVNGESDPPEDECRRLGQLLSDRKIDLACIGIGENGHIAFNDPPADFTTRQPYLVVELDEACRKQQMGEGWFPTLEDVPTRAISMSVRQLLESEWIVCSVPDRRKAQALHDTLYGKITPQVPASILRTHSRCQLFTDHEGASLLQQDRKFEA